MTWKETFSGRRIDLLDPDPAEIVLSDIAKGLSGTNRFTGHTQPLENVARHSIYVMLLLEEEFPGDFLLHVLGLCHDVHEAYTGDISRPMKLALRALGCRALDHIEALVQAACRISLDLPPPTKAQEEIIKRADTVMLVTERHALMPNTGQRAWETESIQPHPGLSHWLVSTHEVQTPEYWADLFEQKFDLAHLLFKRNK
jgi:hypothetical protein